MSMTAIGQLESTYSYSEKNSSSQICFVLFSSKYMMLHLSKWQSIFIHAINFWQQDQMFVYCFNSVSDRNIAMIFICSIDVIILLEYYLLAFSILSFSVKIMHH